jgi:DNA polymerase-3 subunit beta
VQSVVERRNTIPILSNVLIETSSDGLVKIMATDLDLQVIEGLDAVSVESEGATTVSAHLLFDIARKLPDGSQVSFETSDNRMTLKAGRSRFQLPTLPRDDFPTIVEGDLPTSFEIPAKTLAELIDRTRFAISTEETRYYLNGIYLHDTKVGEVPMLRAVATDGHRLARFEMALPDGGLGMPGVIVPRKTGLGMPGVIVPRKTVGEVRKLIDESDGAVEVALSDTRIRFTFDSTVLTSKLIDGTFPDYVRVIPQGNDKILKVDRAEFAAAVDRVSTISSERGRAVKLALSDGKMVLSVNNPDSGSATEELGADYAADAIEIGFNARYLLDVAGQLETGTAEFRFADPGSPTLITDDGEIDALYVLMPMRV